MSAPSVTPRRPPLLYRVMMAFIGLFDRWLHMSCRAFIRLASAGFDRELTRREQFRQSLHRAICGLCRTQERRLARIRDLTREMGHAPETVRAVSLSSEAAERLRDAVTRASGSNDSDQR